MITGLEGIVTAGGIVMNDRLATYPRVELSDIVGLRSLPDYEEIKDQAIGRLGEVPRNNTRSGKTITFEGIIKAQSIIDLRTHMALVSAAFQGTGEMQFDHEPHASDPNAGSLPTRWYRALPLACDPVESWPEQGKLGTATHGFEAVFSMPVRLSDPRFYWPTAVTGHDDTLSTGGGEAPPLTPDGESDPPSGNSLTVTVNNTGNTATEGIITITGRVWNPVVSNLTTGKFLRFDDLDVEAAEELEIDSKRRRIRRASGANNRHKLDETSDWWDPGEDFLAVGSNQIRLNGYVMGAGAELDVEFYPADIA